ncbi:MAG: hypothetical protein II038_11910, partial [Lachnospiraceae bacterium]|nr:hypothetical protein [Lachnospiraceae bacterium]
FFFEDCQYPGNRLFIAVFFFQSSGNPQCWNLFMGLYALVSAPVVCFYHFGLQENLETGYRIGGVKGGNE